MSEESVLRSCVKIFISKYAQSQLSPSIFPHVILMENLRQCWCRPEKWFNCTLATACTGRKRKEVINSKETPLKLFLYEPPKTYF